MMRILVDSDVVVAAMLRNEQQSAESIVIMDALEAGEFLGITTPVMMANVQYVLSRRWEVARNKPDRERVVAAMNDILALFSEMIPVTMADFYASMASKFVDLEDGLQHFAAMRAGGIDAIITCNGKDYDHAQIAHYSPVEFTMEFLGDE